MLLLQKIPTEILETLNSHWVTDSSSQALAKFDFRSHNGADYANLLLHLLFERRCA